MSNAFEVYHEDVVEKNSKERIIEIILKHLGDIEKFFLSDYVQKTRKQEFGFNKPEQFETLVNVRELKRQIDKVAQEDPEMIMGNHMAHVLGNSITTLAGAYALKFEHGDFYSEDETGKPLPVKNFERIKGEMELMLFYIKELQSNPDLIKEEIDSTTGYLKHFVEFLSCDLPTQTPEQLKLFKFFCELKRGEVTAENFFEASVDVQNYLDVEKLRENFPEVVDQAK